MNRIEQAIERTREALHSLDYDKIMDLEDTCVIDVQEHFAYQEVQSHAHAAGKISLEEATIVYRALGEAMSDTNGGWQPDVDLATKIVVTQLMAELALAPVG